MDGEGKRPAADESTLMRLTAPRPNLQVVERAIFLSRQHGSHSNTREAKKTLLNGLIAFNCAHAFEQSRFMCRATDEVLPSVGRLRCGLCLCRSVLFFVFSISRFETTMNYYVRITAKDTLAEVHRHLQKHGQEAEKPSEVTKQVTIAMDGTISP